MLFVNSARAADLEYEYGNWTAQLTGYGTAGAIYTDSPDALYDWRLRGQATYKFNDDWKGGAIYSIGQWEIDQRQAANDAFVYAETGFGRAELGITNSISAKLGLGLPDVGGLRINRDSLVFKSIDTEPNISRLGTTGAQYALRANVVSSPDNPVQFGFSYAPGNDSFNNAFDFGMKYKSDEEKTKTALSLGASFIDNPHDMRGDVFGPRVYADWRAQLTAGLNLQYNSWNFGLTARAIYDKNPIQKISDGMSAGAGASYDFLSWSASASYMLSAVGIFHSGENYLTHTGILSLRYKINKFWNVWLSTGYVESVESSPFVSGGVMVKF